MSLTSLKTEKILPTMLIVPSGIGCSIGGSAGDAIPSARLLAAASGCLITHPNVMNGALLYWNDERIQYVEGYSLDQFANEKIALEPVIKQRVGLLLDSGLEDELRLRHLQVADACKASLGLDIGQFVETKEPLKISLKQGLEGSSWGNIDNPKVLIEAGKKLKNLGATAIAVVTRIPESFDSVDLQNYRSGLGVDPIAGAEAIISHLLVRELGLPCAHSPALQSIPICKQLDPRVAAEELGHTFLTSVFVGLSRAPNLIPITEMNNRLNNFSHELIKPHHLGALIAPSSALGGEAVLSCLKRNIPLICVSNKNVLNVTEDSLKIGTRERENIFYAENYIEAAGILLSLKEGINIQSLKRPIARIEDIASY